MQFLAKFCYCMQSEKLEKDIENKELKVRLQGSRKEARLSNGTLPSFFSRYFSSSQSIVSVRSFSFFYVICHRHAATCLIFAYDLTHI